jgi:RNA polymerase-binding transcription factor DksA
MCIRVQYAPRHEITDPWDAARQVITIPAELSAPQYALRALRTVLRQLDVEQGSFGARCWCGEQISLLPRVPQQRRSGKVIHSGA